MLVRSIILLIAALAIGCGFDRADTAWEITRLGESVGRKLVDKEAREILASLPSFEVEANLVAGCELHLAYASKRPESKRTFRVMASTADGAAHSILEAEVENQSAWIDVRYAVPEPGVASLRFELDGDILGSFWGRPIAQCPLAQEKPLPSNVILVSLDTLRADRLGVYGNRSGLTPNLDRIAESGSLFENAYAPYPNTLTSHATLFTGYHPSQHGVIAGHMRNVPDDARTLARAFANAGHYAVGFTENGYVASNFGFAAGFDRYHNGGEIVKKGQFPGAAEDTFDLALSWIREHAEIPFFMFLHSYEVHIPYDPDPAHVAQMHRPGEPRTRGRFESHFGSLMALSVNRGEIQLDDLDRKMIETLYDAETIGLDAQVGRLEQQLEALGLVDRTLLVFVSDHGEEFAEHGFVGHGETIHRQVLHVPMVFRQPGNVPAGRRIDTPVGLLDVGPTIAALAGIEPPFPGAPARSLVPRMRGSTSQPARPVFSELENSLGACGDRKPGEFRSCPYDGVAVREGSFAFIQREGETDVQLYDYTRDPGEHENVARQFPERIAYFESLVARYRALVSDYTMELKPRVAIDPDVAEKLKALGYVE